MPENKIVPEEGVLRAGAEEAPVFDEVPVELIKRGDGGGDDDGGEPKRRRRHRVLDPRRSRDHGGDVLSSVTQLFRIVSFLQVPPNTL